MCYRIVIWHGYYHRDTIEFPNLREAYAFYMAMVASAEAHRIFCMFIQRTADHEHIISYARTRL